MLYLMAIRRVVRVVRSKWRRILIRIRWLARRGELERWRRDRCINNLWLILWWIQWWRCQQLEWKISKKWWWTSQVCSISLWWVQWEQLRIQWTKNNLMEKLNKPPRMAYLLSNCHQLQLTLKLSNSKSKWWIWSKNCKRNVIKFSVR